MAARERDLFRAIVLAGTALVTTASGCGQASTGTDSGAAPSDAGTDAATLMADAGRDASVAADAGHDAGDDAMVIIL